MLASAFNEVDASHQTVKIVHIETGRHFYGGPQQVVWLVKGLIKAGVECLLVCTPDSAINAVARQAGVPVANVPCKGDHDLRFAWRLYRLLRRERPDLVHCHSRRGADLPGGWSAFLAKVPAVLSRRVDNAEASRLAAIRYWPFATVIAISDNIASLLRENGLEPHKLAVIRDAVDVESMQAEPDRKVLQDAFEISDKAFAIAVVAQLIPRKGHRFLLDVLPGLLTAYPHIKVVFFGAGEHEEATRLLTRKLGLSGAVRFAGFRDDLDHYLGAFDLLVHPAEKEGLGVAMLKAAAAGLPVIAFDTAGAKEAVVNRKTGVLVALRDLDGLQRAIEVMIQEPEMRQEMGAAGRQRMRDEFAVAAMVESHLTVYRACLHE